MIEVMEIPEPVSPLPPPEKIFKNPLEPTEPLSHFVNNRLQCQSSEEKMAHCHLSHSEPLSQTGMVIPTSPKISPPVQYRYIGSSDELKEVVRFFQDAKVLAIDTETTGAEKGDGLDPHKGKIRLIQIAAAGHHVAVVDMFEIPSEELAPLKDLLAGSAIKVFHNAKFDLKFLQIADIPVKGQLCDTQIAAQLLISGLKDDGYNLKDVVKDYLLEELPKEQQVSDWSGDLTPYQIEYAARDAAVLLRLREVLIPLLRDACLVKVAKIEFDTIPAFVEMELNGMKVDRDKLNALCLKMEEDAKEAADNLKVFIGDINPNSQPQMLKALKDMGVPVESTGKDTLAPLAADYPVVKALIKYRKTSKLHQAFGKLPERIHPVTGRIHPSFDQIGAVTGRVSCKEPNLQQTPRDKSFRGCFTPEPGNVLVIGDYSQIELRNTAEVTQDKRMLDAYNNGEDLHRLTASIVMDKPLQGVTKQERSAAKAVNFGLIYAMGAATLREYAENSYGVSMSLEEAEIFRERFFEAYEGVAQWHIRVKQAKPKETRTLAGRRRLWNGWPKITELYNAPIQGTSGDITKKALSLLSTRMNDIGGGIVLTVHDEIVIEVPESKAEEAVKLLRDTMIEAGREYLKTVPVEVDVAYGKSWADKA